MTTARAVGIVSAIAAATLAGDYAYADGPFSFPPFSSSSPSPNVPQPSSQAPSPVESSPTKDEPPRVRNDNPRTTSAGFDPEALERGAKALREITTSSQAKKVRNLEIIGMSDFYVFVGNSVVAVLFGLNTFWFYISFFLSI